MAKDRPYKPRGKYKKGVAVKKRTYGEFQLARRSFQLLMARCGYGITPQADGQVERIEGRYRDNPNSYTLKKCIQPDPRFLDATPEDREVTYYHPRLGVITRKHTASRGFWLFFTEMGLRPWPKATVERIVCETNGVSAADGGPGHYTLKGGPGNYPTDNITWSTDTGQARNKTTNRNITATYKGRRQTHCVAVWTKLTGLPEGVISARLARNWTEEAAVNTPVYRRPPRTDADGKS